MKIWFLLILLLAFSWPVAAQEKVKIGYIDLRKAIQDSQTGKKAKEKFQAEVKRVESEMTKERQQLEQMQADLEKKSRLLKEEELRNLERDFQRRRANYERSRQEWQMELRQRDEEMASEIAKDLEKVTVEVGKSEQFTLILERSNILYSDQGIDITDKVVDIYNRQGSGKSSPKK